MSESILQEAERLITQDRNAAYGDYIFEAQRIAEMWSTILDTPVKAVHVPLCMIAVKLVRESHAHKRDNLCDVAGYAALAQRVAEHTEGLDKLCREFTEEAEEALGLEE